MQKQYRKNIRAIRDVLSGKRAALVRKMNVPAMHRVFENAHIISRMHYAAIGLSAVPRRIEGYDISNISGVHATGSMVVFANGRPDKSQYRKFTIRTTSGGDTAMLREILERRLKHSEWAFPDLIIVDGGTTQLNVATLACGSIPIIALTKDNRHRGDHIFTSRRKTPIPLTRLPEPVRNLILAVDAEAHRFAITHYRLIHRKRTLDLK